MINFIWTMFKDRDEMNVCPECGHKNPVDYKFCENCGISLLVTDEKAIEDEANVEEESTKVIELEETATEMQRDNYAVEEPSEQVESVVFTDKPPQYEESKLSSKKKLIITIIIGILVLAAVITAIVIYIDNKNSAEYNARIDSADKYTQKLDYKNAEAAYLEAIEIEPKEADAYVKLADIYIARERYEEAEKILEKGKEEAGGNKIVKKLKMVKLHGIYGDYLNEVIIPEIELADVEEELDVNELNSGLISAQIEDFNKDKVPDLLVVSYGESASTEFTFSLYTCKKDEVELLDETVVDYDDSSYSASKYNVFLKKHDDNMYIIIGAEALDPGGGEEVIEIYEIEESIEKCCSLSYADYVEGTSYWLNDEVVSEYEFGDEYDPNTDEVVNSEGIAAFTDALGEYGIEVDRFTSSGKEGIAMSCLDYDKEDESEIPLCYVQHGIYLGEWNIDLTTPERRYIADYTNLREMYESEEVQPEEESNEIIVDSEDAAINYVNDYLKNTQIQCDALGCDEVSEDGYFISGANVNQGHSTTVFLWLVTPEGEIYNAETDEVIYTP